MAQVVAAVPDLFFRSRVLETAKTLQVSVEVARDADEVLQPLETIRSLMGVPVVGFLAHEQVDLREKALEAGCAEVLTKGQFSAKLPELLGRAV
jgi:CheY-like chemotaxis protein